MDISGAELERERKAAVREFAHKLMTELDTLARCTNDASCKAGIAGKVYRARMHLWQVNAAIASCA